MLILSLALLGSASGLPAVSIDDDPDRLVCRSKIDRRTRMRTGKVCKTVAEWRGDYRDADAAADAAARTEPQVQPVADTRPAEPQI